MSRYLIFTLIFACLQSACGVKRYPDTYYRHPVQFDGFGATSPTPVGSTLPEDSPSLYAPVYGPSPAP